VSPGGEGQQSRDREGAVCHANELAATTTSDPTVVIAAKGEMGEWANSLLKPCRRLEA